LTCHGMSYGASNCFAAIKKGGLRDRLSMLGLFLYVCKLPIRNQERTTNVSIGQLVQPTGY